MYHRIPPTENDAESNVTKFPIENLTDRVQNMVIQMLENQVEAGSNLYEDDDSSLNFVK
jgi:hypothetical protein